MELPFEERLQVGECSEKKFENTCILENIIHISTKRFFSWNNDFDLRHGDYLIIPQIRLFRIDVKGGAIAKNSILNFLGEFFVIYETSNESGIDGLVFSPITLRRLTQNFKKNDWDRLVYSKQDGILYSRLKTYWESYAITIDEFFKKIKNDNNEKTKSQVS